MSAPPAERTGEQPLVLQPPAGTAWTGLHYRRSLASRVTVLTTLAVGFAVSIVAFAAYATVRAQTISALDDSLRARAYVAAKSDTLDALAQESISSWALGAAGVRIAFVDASNDPVRIQPAGASPSFGISDKEIAVAQG